jgi:hypothetical protein
MIMDLAEQDLGLLRKLDMAAAVLHEDDKKLEARLRKAIDGVTRTRALSNIAPPSAGRRKWIAHSMPSPNAPPASAPPSS